MSKYYLSQERIDSRIDHINSIMLNYNSRYCQKLRLLDRGDVTSLKPGQKKEIEKHLGTGATASYHIEEDKIYISESEFEELLEGKLDEKDQDLAMLFQGIRDKEGFCLDYILLHENVHRSAETRFIRDKRTSSFYIELTKLMLGNRAKEEKFECLQNPQTRMRTHGLSVSFEAKDKKFLNFSSKIDEAVTSWIVPLVIGNSPHSYLLPRDNSNRLEFLSLLMVGEEESLLGKHTDTWKYFLNHPKREEFIRNYLAGGTANKAYELYNKSKDEGMEVAVIHISGSPILVNKIFENFYPVS